MPVGCNKDQILQTDTARIRIVKARLDSDDIPFLKYYIAVPYGRGLVYLKTDTMACGMNETYGGSGS